MEWGLPAHPKRFYVTYDSPGLHVSRILKLVFSLGRFCGKKLFFLGPLEAIILFEVHYLDVLATFIRTAAKCYLDL